MKFRYLFSAAVLALVTSGVYAGFTQPAPVVVDLDNGFAQGDQVTARATKNDVDFIGCGIRVFDDGIFPTFDFGFCQAQDSDEVQVTCFTQNANLLEAMHATSDYAFITFSWVDDGFGGFECTRIGFSTQSFYLPKGTKGNEQNGNGNGGE